MTLSVGVVPSSEYPLKPLAFGEETDKRLKSNCVLTPVDVMSATSPILPLSQYVKDREGHISEKELNLII